MARRSHKLSLATKLKIATSLKGNKNAYRGGPKKPLTARQKVANINARSKTKKAVLSDAQIRQRQSVAKRLRARARAEEAGITPDHSKAIPTPNVEKKSPEVQEVKARVHGAVPRATVKKDVAAAPKTDSPPTLRPGETKGMYQARLLGYQKTRQAAQENAARQSTAKTNAERYLQMHGTAGAQKKLNQLYSRKKLSTSDRAHAAALSDVVAKANKGTVQKKVGDDVRIGNGQTRFKVVRHNSDGTTTLQSSSSFGGRKPATRTVKTSRLNNTSPGAAIPKADRSKPSPDPLQKGGELRTLAGGDNFRSLSDSAFTKWVRQGGAEKLSTDQDVIDAFQRARSTQTATRIGHVAIDRGITNEQLYGKRLK